MGLLKYAVLGTAVAFGIKQLTKKRSDGTSIMDDLTNRSPELMDKAKEFVNQTVDQLSNNLKQQPSQS